VTEFVKMHGLGNDFILIDCLKEPLPENKLPELAQEWCRRNFGIGADGLILVLPSKVGHFRMRIFNPDGSEAEMCGNGIRCFAKYVYERGITKQTSLKVETLAGIIQPKLRVKSGKVESIKVDMGQPGLLRSQIPMKGEDTKVIREKLKVLGEKREITCVSMGNPHCVLFVNRLEFFPVEQTGSAIENHQFFPQRTNVEFVQVKSPNEIKARVWERGVGETLACGTGACASLVAGVLTKKTDHKATVHLLGGDLLVEWRKDNKHVYLTGPAAEVFVGNI